MHTLLVLPPEKPGTCFVTMSVGQQWDNLLDASYKQGWIVLGLDDNENPVAAYQIDPIPADEDYAPGSGMKRALAQSPAVFGTAVQRPRQRSGRHR